MSCIVLSTGGTGGHIFPALKLSEELQARGHKVVLMTDQRGEKYQGGAQFEAVHVMSLYKGSGLLSKIRQVIDIGLQTIRARHIYASLKPDLVIGFGGYTSSPALLAARSLGIPFMVHEQNAVLGRVNRWMATHAVRLFTGFPKTRGIPERIQPCYVGNPVRDDLLSVQTPPKMDRFRLFIFGGSQGAALFSKIIPQALQQIPHEHKASLEVVMQCREELLDRTKRDLDAAGVNVIALNPFFNDMANQLSQADLVIARAGAMTVAELAVTGSATIFVPLKIAMDNHQYYNVKPLQETGAVWVMTEDDLTVDSLAILLKDLMKNPEALRQRGELLKKTSTPEATQLMAQEIEQFLCPNQNHMDKNKKGPSYA